MGRESAANGVCIQKEDYEADRQEREVKYTFWLLFSTFVAVFGNSFLYGYNIGVVNSPAEICKAFYSDVYAERQGLLPLTTAPPTTTPTSNMTLTTVVMSGTNTTGNDSNPAGNGTNGKKEAEPLIDDNFLDLMWSITVAIFVLFGMIGAFSSGKIADYFGRKKGMIIITFLMFIAAVFGGVPVVAKSPECLIISRAFVGLHCGINISLASLYLAEISPKKIRGAIGTCHQLFITVGILWSMVLGLPELAGNVPLWPFVFAFNAVPSLVCLLCMPFCPESPRFLLMKKNDESGAKKGTTSSWPALFAFNALPALVCLILLPICPESPRYLLMKQNDEDGARKALRRLRGYHDVDDEIDEMRIEARKMTSVKQFTLKQLLTTPSLKLPVIIAVMSQVAQQWSGINAVMSYSSYIFKQAKVEEDNIPYVVVGQGAINVLATIVALPLMEKAGRRPLLLWPMCGMAGSFLILTIFLNLMNDPANEASSKIFAIICIIAMLTYVIGFALGLGPIPFIVVSEIFRQEPRAAAMSFALAFNWICNFILMLTFRFIQKGIGAYTYLIFIVILVGSIIFIFFFVPETKNKTFDEIAMSIGMRRKGKHSLPQQEAGEELEPMGPSTNKV